MNSPTKEWAMTIKRRIHKAGRRIKEMHDGGIVSRATWRRWVSGKASATMPMISKVERWLDEHESRLS